MKVFKAFILSTLSHYSKKYHSNDRIIEAMKKLVLNSIQRPPKASFAAAKRKYKKRAICKAARQTILDMGQIRT
jgi:hypothetical protein